MNRRVVLALIAVLAVVAVVATVVATKRPHRKRGAPGPVERLVVEGPRVERPPPEAVAGRPNLVVVIGCTVRRDQTTPYGAPADVTPFLDGLARGGARFDDAIATSSWTREATAGLLTGVSAASWGLADPRPALTPVALVEEAVTLPERLRAAGWVTLGVTANPNLNAEFGMAQGFDRYRDAAAERGFAQRRRVSGRDTLADALALLDGRAEEERTRPFYLQLVLIDVHMPRVPTPEELAAVASADVPSGVREYRALLRRLDGVVGALDTELAARGHDASDTFFVFTADHGEGLSFPEHHLNGHGRRMYPSTVAIPWIARGPGIAPGTRVEGLASGEDFAPTLLGLLSVPGDPAGPGRDWSGLLRAGGRTDRERAYALSMYKGADVASIWTPSRQCQQDYGSRGADGPMVAGCFDRAADPTFASPLEDRPLLTELGDWRTARLAEGGRRGAVDAVAAEGTTLELEALGYVE